MDIQGFQKLTLLDFPGRVACTVFLSGCDFRCPFCHNSELITPGETASVMTEEALLAFLQKRKGLLDGVAFTGGEPLMRRELPALFEKVRALGYPIKLDTNGNHPDQLQAVLAAGLVDYVAMDIKNSPDRYAKTVGLEHIHPDRIQKSITLLMQGKVDFEFRTTVMNELHDEHSFEQIGKWIHGAPAYFLQPFKDRDTVLFSGFTAPGSEQLSRYADIVRPHVKSVGIRGDA